jgi:hypothetical protein
LHRAEVTERSALLTPPPKAGFLFGERLDRTGQTGKLITGGPGGSKCKDDLLSVVVNRNV